MISGIEIRQHESCHGTPMMLSYTNACVSRESDGAVLYKPGNVLSYARGGVGTVLFNAQPTQFNPIGC